MLERLIRFIFARAHCETTDSPKTQEPTVRLLIPINSAWISAGEITPAQLLDYYLDLGTPRHEVLAAAVLVYADGKPWNRPEDSEGFFHVQFWLSAVAELLEGSSCQDIWAWEESRMRAVHNDNLVVLEERTHHVQSQLSPVCFQLQRFASELAEATRVAVDLLSGLKEVARERYPREWQSACRVAVQRAERLQNVSPTPATQVEEALAHLEDLETKCQTNLGRSPIPGTAESPAKRLQLVLDYLTEEGLASAWRALSTKLS